jgi:hypothetical protein
LNAAYRVYKKLVGLNLNFARSLAHSGWRRDMNPADYPNFPGAASLAGYPSEAAFAAAFAGALGTGAGLVSQVNVPHTLVGATGNYHLRAGFDGSLRFNYGSYTDNTIWNSPNCRPNVLYVQSSPVASDVNQQAVRRPTVPTNLYPRRGTSWVCGVAG